MQIWYDAVKKTRIQTISLKDSSDQSWVDFSSYLLAGASSECT